MFRTHKLNELNINNVGEEVILSGWVSKIRDINHFIFIDLRDRYGITQILVNEDSGIENLELARNIKSEYVIKIVGKVQERTSKNPKLATGDIEILAQDIQILSKSKALPFNISDDEELNENIRLTYRYLDIRRKRMLNNIIKRDKALFSIREFMNENGFLDIDTPILAKSTPEGARDFIVPSRIQKGDFYALPQSPQLFKQTLMVAGVDKYYQMAKCFRDEDLRADRQPEFIQLDLEMSFVEQEDILVLVEKLAKKVLKDVVNIDKSNEIFERITYDYAMDNYGSDKPDLRFDMKIKDISNIVKNKGFSVFDNADTVRCIIVPSANIFSRKKIKELEDFIKIYYNAKGLAYFKVDESGEISSPVAKFFNEDTIVELFEYTNIMNNEIMFIVADTNKIALDSLGALRLKMGNELELINKDEYKFLWVTDFPMFEWSEEEGRYKAQHHPFTSVKEEDIHYLDDNQLDKVKTNAYDLVLNGYEIGGGSIRIHDADLQNKVFEKLGISEEDRLDKFGFFMEILKYGVPPHGGLAFGLDRWLMVMLKENSIKEVIPFPKTNKGQDLMTGAPSDVEIKQLEEDLMLKSLVEK